MQTKKQRVLENHPQIKWKKHKRQGSGKREQERIETAERFKAFMERLRDSNTFQPDEEIECNY